MGGGGHFKCGHPRALHCVNPGLPVAVLLISNNCFTMEMLNERIISKDELLSNEFEVIHKAMALIRVCFEVEVRTVIYIFTR